MFSCGNQKREDSFEAQRLEGVSGFPRDLPRSLLPWRVMDTTPGDPSQSHVPTETQGPSPTLRCPGSGGALPRTCK